MNEYPQRVISAIANTNTASNNFITHAIIRPTLSNVTAERAMRDFSGVIRSD
jgi:hypothetical protein